ncbi:TrkH family potassium uptake protein [Marinilabiliaceae bacterium JC040]|nr:TrkH family potassium uptake protein [Marinilabiliaceae bacterium JC040]
MRGIHIRRILGLAGTCLLIESIFILIAYLVALYYEESKAIAVLGAFAFTAFSGALLLYSNKHVVKEELSIRDSFIAVSTIWLFMSLFGTLPYIFSNTIPNYVNALFETISGFTTTGSSILSDIEALPKSILFWRAETHWLGGMGIIVLVVAVMPFIKKNGINLMIMEGAFLSVDKIKPKLIDMARQFWGIYILLTGLETLFLKLAGMSWFDSVCHSFATTATGGFSTKNTSLIDFSPTIQYIVIIFMFLSGMNFALHILLIMGKPRSVFKNEEFKWYLGLSIGIPLLIALFALKTFNFDFELAYRHALFQIVSIITATGFASADYELWPNICIVLVFLSMFIGASVGSTGGGIKIARYVIAFKKIKQIFVKMLNPSYIYPVKYNNKVLPQTLVHSVSTYIVIYFIVFLVGSLIMTFLGSDIKTATSSIITTLGGIGPGIGNIGPTENFASVSMFGKLYLCFNMILGRLEIFPLLIIGTKAFYK